MAHLFVDNSVPQKYGNGSLERPFDSISKALQFVQDNPAFEIVLVSEGIYHETLELPEQIILAGFGQDVVIKNPDIGQKNTVTTNEDSTLLNLNIQGGKYGIYIPKNTGKTSVSGCSVSKASHWGIVNEQHDSIEDNSLIVSNSTITQNERQGLYLRKGTFRLTNSKVIKNGEEGVDLHLEMKSTIANSTISENGEGGIET